MKHYFFISFLLVILFLGSCSITQEYHFNKDLSGKYSLEMKMGDLINMVKSMDTTGNAMTSMDTLDYSFNEVAIKYKDAGAKNVKVGWKDDKTTLYIKFDFKNIEDLNSILKNSEKESSMTFFSGNTESPGKIKHKGKRTLSFDFPEFNNDTISMKDLESMKDYIRFETIFSFDRKIKSMSNKNATISDDKKSFKFSGKLNDILNENYTMDTDVKLKFR